MRLRGSAFILSVLIAAAPTARAGGSVGGGTGLALDLWKHLVSQEEFQRVVAMGLQGETVQFQSRTAEVRSVNFEERTIELETSDSGEPLVIRLIESAE